MRVLLTVQYDGGRYNGWQAQPSGNTVQQVIEEAILSATGSRAVITGSGRTDSGVHALRQKAHFDTDFNVPAEKFVYILNRFLPNDVKILSSVQVDEDFNARYSAKQKTYVYSCYSSDIILPLKDRYSVKIDGGYDKKLMEEVALEFLGKHDFKCFLASGSSVKNTVREIYASKLDFLDDGFTYTVTGNGFLYNMVRTMVGTLLYVGYGKLSLQDVKDALVTGNRKKVGKTMPPHGLCLQDVVY